MVPLGEWRTRNSPASVYPRRPERTPPGFGARQFAGHHRWALVFRPCTGPDASAWNSAVRGGEHHSEQHGSCRKKAWHNGTLRSGERHYGYPRNRLREGRHGWAWPNLAREREWLIMSEEWKAAYDQRQFSLMIEHLRRFEEGASDLSSLIAGLDALLNCLEAPDEEWKQRFRSEWWTLEQVYAVALHHGQTELPAEEEVLVNQAVTNMKQLLAERVPVQAEANNS